jgi:phospholipid/cholesterol/gamma-HCH transport system permease protein
MEDFSPRLISDTTSAGHGVRPLGHWTAAQLAVPAHWAALARSLRWLAVQSGGRAQAELAWDLRGVARLDHLGAQLLWHQWGHTWPTQLQALPDQRAVLERVARYSISPPLQRALTLRQMFLRLGAFLLALAGYMGAHLVAGVRLVGGLLLDLVRLLRAPQAGPWRDISGHLYQTGATALPITALVGFLIGVVLAYLTAQQLRLFGAEYLIVNMLGLSLTRELGPVLAAVLIAGRSGSAITAQIGVMRVTEELDAMRVMGIPLGYRLVLPRALALSLAMPLIALWTTVAALVGGMLSADVTLGITPSFFISALPRVVPLVNLTLAMGKSVVFGLLIALVGCHYGLRIQPNTESLGRGTTASVVTAITVVILVDALFAVIFKNLGL